MVVWHYTKAIHLPRILAEGCIKPATAGVRGSKRPIVWFSTNEWFEWTVGTGRLENGNYVEDTFEEMNAKYGLARIGVARETAPYTWRDLKKLSGMRPGDAKKLVQAAIRRGASPHEWRGTFEPVPKEKWLAVQVYEGERWVDRAEVTEGAEAGDVSDGGPTHRAR